MSEDPFNLQRFIEAQRQTHEDALAELTSGLKLGHWIWFILPQLEGLGQSFKSQFYGLTGIAEARAYHAHPVLGPRLRLCVEAILAHEGKSAADILGGLDALKFRSSMTLFHHAAPQEPLYARALARLFADEEDRRTLEIIGKLA